MRFTYPSTLHIAIAIAFSIIPIGCLLILARTMIEINHGNNVILGLLICLPLAFFIFIIYHKSVFPQHDYIVDADGVLCTARYGHFKVRSDRWTWDEVESVNIEVLTQGFAGNHKYYYLISQIRRGRRLTLMDDDSELKIRVMKAEICALNPAGR